MTCGSKERRSSHLRQEADRRRLDRAFPLSCVLRHAPGAIAHRPGDGFICGIPFSSAEDIGEDAVEDVGELVPDPLNEGQANALTTKIQNAIDKAANGQYNAAINQMEAFIGQVTDMVSNGTVTWAEAAPLIEQAESLIAIWTELL